MTEKFTPQKTNESSIGSNGADPINPWVEMSQEYDDEARKARAAERGLPEDASWGDINQAHDDEIRKAKAAERGLPEDASWGDINQAHDDESQQKQVRPIGKKVNIYGGDIDTCVNMLLERAHEENGPVYMEFNGHILNSEGLTIDRAYQEVLGMSKAEHDAQISSAHEELEKKAEVAKEKIPNWVEEGYKFVKPEQQEEWKECVEARAGDIYHGRDLDDALKLMKMLDAGVSYEDVAKEFDAQGHSVSSYGMVRGILGHFAKKGPDFIKYLK